MTLSERRHRLIRRLFVATADLAEPMWGAGFRLAGLLAGGQAPRWRSAGGKLILVLAPHPDDETLGCAGTMRLHKKAGDIVGVVYVTDGRLAASPLAPEQLANQRQREARCVRGALQFDMMEWLGFQEGQPWIAPLIARLKSLLEEHQPDVIYTASRLDFHPDHHRTAYALAQALAGNSLAPAIRIYQVHVPLTGVLTNLLADVTEEEAAMRAAFDCYQSQWWHLGRTLRMRRYAARYYGRRRYCEPFWEMSTDAFCRLHEAEADFNRDGTHWSLTTFGGLRFFSWPDPHAYLKGRSWRNAAAASEFR